jgi:hypothetical protein
MPIMNSPFKVRAGTTVSLAKYTVSFKDGFMTCIL